MITAATEQDAHQAVARMRAALDRAAPDLASTVRRYPAAITTALWIIAEQDSADPAVRLALIRALLRADIAERSCRRMAAGGEGADSPESVIGDARGALAVLPPQGAE